MSVFQPGNYLWFVRPALPLEMLLFPGSGGKGNARPLKIKRHSCRQSLDYAADSFPVRFSEYLNSERFSEIKAHIFPPNDS